MNRRLSLRAVLAAVALALCSHGVEGATGSPSPAPSQTPCPKPADPIAIESIRISPMPVRSGTTVSGVVIATCNVAAVTAQIGTYRVGMPKTSPGVFQAALKVPRFIWPGRFRLVVTAIRTDGATVQSVIPVDVRW